MLNQTAIWHWEAEQMYLRHKFLGRQELPKEVPGYGLATQTVLMGLNVHCAVDSGCQGEVWVYAHELPGEVIFELNCCNMWTKFNWEAYFKDPFILNQFFAWLKETYVVAPISIPENMPWDLL